MTDFTEQDLSASSFQRVDLSRSTFRGADMSDLQVDTLWLTGLMLLAMTIAVTRFRRTLD